MIDRLFQRRALTLVELVVVLAIMVALSSLIVPLVSGLGFQTNASINATVVNDVNQAVRTYYTRFDDRYPDGWDSLLDANGAISTTQMHPNLTLTSLASGPGLTTSTLDKNQAESLNSAGIRTLYVLDQTVPNGLLTTATTVTTGAKIAVIGPSSFSNDALSLSNLNLGSGVNNTYVVLGLGTNSTIRSSVMTDVPLIQSADPSFHYARVLCVFMVPGAGSPETFAAKYVGCFLPDGTSLRTNLDNYNNLKNAE